MADKNLHDIKIDELDSPKKTPLKNILTLLALLFIILVISVVITKLILNTDEGKDIESNASNTTVLTDIESNITKNVDEADKTIAVPVISNVPTTLPSTTSNTASTMHERNMTSRTKTPLRTYTPAKEVKEVKKVKEVQAIKTYKDPKSTTTRTTVKKEYIDKVVVTRNTSTTKKSIGSTVSKLVKGFYIKIGTYNNTKTAITGIKKTGLNYKLVKTENGLTRVYIGKFNTKKGANSSLKKAQKINPAAYIYEAK